MLETTPTALQRVVGARPWICSTCLRTAKAKVLGSSRRASPRGMTSTSRSRQNVAPTMEQLRAPFSHKNKSSLWGWTVDITRRKILILADIMPWVSYWAPLQSLTAPYPCTRWCVTPTWKARVRSAWLSTADMSTDRLGWSAHQSLRAFLCRRPYCTPSTCHVLSAVACHLQWLCVGCSAMEVHASAKRSTGSTWRDSPGLLHGNQQERRRYYRRGNV